MLRKTDLLLGLELVNTTSRPIRRGSEGPAEGNFPLGRTPENPGLHCKAEFAKLPFITPLLYPCYHQYTDGSNFASGGAGALVETNKGLGIYKKGGRKVAMPNLAPLGCLPITRALNTNNTGACIEGLSALAKLHNEALSKSLQELESQLDGFKYSITDKYTSLSKTINNPSKYGFKESKIACCGTVPYRGTFSRGGKRSVKEYELCENVSEYVFFDSIHPTEKVNQQIAEPMWSGTPNITGPYNLIALFEN
ncbi:hypothetical protein ACJW31_05G006100 [Castanea mollissima]